MQDSGQTHNKLEANHFVEIETPVPCTYATNAPPLTLKWHDLTLKVDIKNQETKVTEEKTILDRVSGYAKPGELLVIMGPSGAGKSSLLDCISGRKRDAEGSITVNGAPWTKQMKQLTSYVVQDDVFYETITVREHLIYQAHLRMGKTYSLPQCQGRVDTVMEELGLTNCRDTLIGGIMVRGISGGERKRLSFATEILTNPSLLFVDEPTSGLDSFMAETVVMQLQQLARDGRTVVATIHQPSSELFTLFDQLYLVSDGSTVYHGKASESVEYFGSIGYQCPAFMNPSDYFMRQLVVMDKATDEVGVDRVEALKAAWSKQPNSVSEGPHVSLEDQGILEGSYESPRLEVLGQMAVISQRNITRTLRDQLAFQFLIFQCVIIALIIGLIYLQLDMDQKGIQNFAGVLFFLSMCMVFASANPAFIAVPMELPIIEREYLGGVYNLLAWYLAKNISEIPFQILMPIVFFVPAYFLVGFNVSVGAFLKMQIILVLVYSCGTGLGYMVSCMVRRVDIAPIVGVVVILPFMLFGGLLINSDDAPDYFVWIQYISPIKYGFDSLMNAFWGEISDISCQSAIENCSARTGADVLKNFSITSRSTLDNGLLLLAVNIGLRTIGFLALYFNLKGKMA